MKDGFWHQGMDFRVTPWHESCTLKRLNINKETAQNPTGNGSKETRKRLTINKETAQNKQELVYVEPFLGVL